MPFLTSDNHVSPETDVSSKYKKVIEFHSGHNSELPPAGTNILNLSKGDGSEKNTYNMAVACAAIGIGGNKVIYDENKITLKPQIGDRATAIKDITLPAMPPKLIDVQQTTKIIGPPEPQAGPSTPQVTPAKESGKVGGGGEGSTGKTTKKGGGKKASLNDPDPPGYPKPYIPDPNTKFWVIDGLIRDLKLKDFQAAGIVGNLLSEGGFNPGIVEGRFGILLPMKRFGGYGWAQWTTRGRKDNFINYVKDNFNGFDITKESATNEMNFAFLVWEVKNRFENYMLKGLRQTKTVEGASTQVLLRFEAPATTNKKTYDRFRARLKPPKPPSTQEEFQAAKNATIKTRANKSKSVLSEYLKRKKEGNIPPPPPPKPF
jgi:hypothetical protein